MLKIALFGIQMAQIRIKKLKKSKFLTTFIIAMIVSTIACLAFGITSIHDNIVSTDLDSVLIDFNVRIISDNNTDLDIQELASILHENSHVEQTIIKLFPNPEIFRGAFLAHRNSLINSSGEINNDVSTNIFGLSKDDFDIVQQYINEEIGSNLTTLKKDETVISSFTANRLNLTIGDSFFIHQLNDTSGSSENNITLSEVNFRFKIKHIWEMTINDDIFTEFNNIPSQDRENLLELNDFVLVENQTYFKCMKAFFPSYSNQTILNNGLISVFIDHKYFTQKSNSSSIIELFSFLRTDLWSKIASSKPVNTYTLWFSPLESNIIEIHNTLSNFKFYFLVFGTILVLLLLLFYFSFSHQRNTKERLNLGILKLRGANNRFIVSNYLIEGIIEGSIGGIIGGFFYAIIFSMLVFIVFSNLFINNMSIELTEILTVSSLLANILIGILLGVTGYSLIILQMIDSPLKDLITKFTDYDYVHKSYLTRNRRNFLLLSAGIFIIKFIMDFIIQYEIGGVWSYFLSIIQNILSILLITIPFFLSIGILGYLLNKKETLEAVFSLLISPIMGNLTSLFFKTFWRKPKKTSNLILLISLITCSAIVPTFLISIQTKVSEINITSHIGSDLRLEGEFQHIFSDDFQTFVENNSEIIENSSYLISQGCSFLTGSNDIKSTSIVALDNPTRYLSTVKFEDISIPLKKEAEKKLIHLTANKILAPIQFLEIYDWNIGDERELTLTNGGVQKTLQFTVAEFYHWLPGLEVLGYPENNNQIICNIEYLKNQTEISGEIKTVLMIRFEENSSEQEIYQFYRIVTNNFPLLHAKILNEEIEDYYNSFEGKISDILDIILLLTLIIGSIGMGLFIYSILQAEKYEVSLLRSRGLTKQSLIRLNFTRILLIIIIGISIGLFMGMLTNLIFIYSNQSEYGLYGNLFTIEPLIKIVLFVAIMTVSQLLLSLIAFSSWFRDDILHGLSFKE